MELHTIGTCLIQFDRTTLFGLPVYVNLLMADYLEAVLHIKQLLSLISRNKTVIVKSLINLFIR
jgi:hypothetical protein